MAIEMVEFGGINVCMLSLIYILIESIFDGY